MESNQKKINKSINENSNGNTNKNINENSNENTNKSINENLNKNIDESTDKDKNKGKFYKHINSYNIKKIFRSCIVLAKTLISYITYKLILLIIAVIIASISFTMFKSSIQKKINDNTKVYLSYVVDESLERISLKINEEFDLLNTIALFYIHTNDLNGEDSSQMLKDQMEHNSFVGISLIKTDGESIVSFGRTGITIENDMIDTILDNGRGISSVKYDDTTALEYIELAVPVYYENSVNAILLCDYDMNEFNEVIDTSSFEQVGSTFISQSDGTLISRPESVGKNTNLFELMDSINLYGEKSILKLKNSIQNGETGIMTYGSGKHKRYICYKSVPDTNWYSVSIVSADVIEPVAKKISKLAVNLAMQIILIFAMYFMVIIIVEYKFKNKLKITNKKANK